MPDSLTDSTVPVDSSSSGTLAGEGQATSAPLPSSGEPQSTATPSEQPQAWDSELNWKTPDDAKRDYKNVQAAYTRLSQRVASLGDLNQVSQRLAFVEQLSNSPEFLEWAEAQLAKETTGSQDPQTVQALQIVRREAAQIAQKMMAPLHAQAVEQKTKQVFSEMEAKHGAEWQQQKHAMLELHQNDIRRGLVSPRAEVDFDFNYVEGLYHRVVASDPNYAAKAYEKRIAHKREHSTTSLPGTAPGAVGSGKVKTFEEAAAKAMRDLGMR